MTQQENSTEADIQLNILLHCGNLKSTINKINKFINSEASSVPLPLIKLIEELNQNVKIVTDNGKKVDSFKKKSKSKPNAHRNTKSIIVSNANVANKPWKQPENRVYEKLSYIPMKEKFVKYSATKPTISKVEIDDFSVSHTNDNSKNESEENGNVVIEEIAYAIRSKLRNAWVAQEVADLYDLAKQYGLSYEGNMCLCKLEKLQNPTVNI